MARAMALGLGTLLIAGVSLVGATSAQAAPGPYSVSGVVNTGVATPASGAMVIESSDPQADNWTTTNSDGEFTLTGLADGAHTLTFALDTYDSQELPITINGGNLTLSTPIDLVPSGPKIDVSGVTVTISGSAVVGEKLTVKTTGWPVGTVFSYSWLAVAPWAQSSGNIPDTDSDTFTVTKDQVGSMIYVEVYGDTPTNEMTMVSSPNGIVGSALKVATAPAPADTSGSTPVAQTSTGLPAGPLNPGTAHTANLTWNAADSFVDVYIFSTPTLVGTFPVVNGVAQITLSTAVLGQLATGNHTLVATGQTSGAVQSVALAIGLAATGADNPTVPLIVASLMLLIGAALVVARRRIGQRI